MLGSSADRGVAHLTRQGASQYQWPVPQGNQRMAVTEVEVSHWSPLAINALSGSVVADTSLGKSTAELGAFLRLVAYGGPEVTSDSTANFDALEGARRPEISTKGDFGILRATYPGLDMTLEPGFGLYCLYRYRSWVIDAPDAGDTHTGLAIYSQLHATITVLDR